MTFTGLETTAIATLLLLFGYQARSKIGWLDRLNIPAPVIGGLTATLVILALRTVGGVKVQLDTVLQQPLMIAFFTCLGFAASFRLLRRAGGQAVVLLAASSLVAVLQGLVGAAVAVAFGLKPLLGVLTGTVTLSGGPATGLAFAPQFESAGVAGAAAIATATAMAGILLASIFGAPLATMLIARGKLDPRLLPTDDVIAPVAADIGPATSAEAPDPVLRVLKTVAVVIAAMWLGGIVSKLIQGTGVTLPAYVGSMLVAATIRNFDDATGWLKLPLAEIEVGGAVVLSLFLVMAMMGLDLTLLSGLALPLVVNLVVQMGLIALLVLGPIHWLMGRTYDAAVSAGGFSGFMLGTTANAMAIMRSLVEKYGPAPRAFLTVPLVGSMFLDFPNAIIITVFLNLWR